MNSKHRRIQDSGKRRAGAQPVRTRLRSKMRACPRAKSAGPRLAKRLPGEPDDLKPFPTAAQPHRKPSHRKAAASLPPVLLFLCLTTRFSSSHHGLSARSPNARNRCRTRSRHSHPARADRIDAYRGRCRASAFPAQDASAFLGARDGRNPPRPACLWGHSASAWENPSHLECAEDMFEVRAAILHVTQTLRRPSARSAGRGSTHSTKETPRHTEAIETCC